METYDLIEKLEKIGIGEIVLSNLTENDGLMQGYDIN